MAIRDHLCDLYERSDYSSARYRIAEYLLLNWEKTGQITLSEMAETLYVSKSMLSRFCSDLTEEGSFDSFCIAVRKELQGRFVFQSRLEDIHGKVLPSEHMKELTQQLVNADHVIFVTDTMLVSHLRAVSYLLFDRYVPCEILPFYYDQTILQHISHLGSSSYLVLYEPFDSSYQKMGLRTLEIDFPSFVHSLHTNVLHISHRSIHLPGTRLYELRVPDRTLPTDLTDMFSAQFYRNMVR